MNKMIEPKSTSMFPWSLVAQGTVLVVMLVKEIIDYMDRKKKTEGDAKP